MSMSSNGRVDASLFGISDTEILMMVDDLGDENGWTTTLDLRRQLGEDIEARERSGVAQRMAWLRRYGWLERGETVRVEQGERLTHTTEWRLTAMGHALIDHPDLSRAVAAALAKLNPAQRVRLTRDLGEAGASTAPEIRQALRRQWMRSMQTRR